MKEPVESVWQRQERATRGPAPEYSRAQIAAAALAVADADGLSAVSMRRVAAAIGAAPASLYRYVTGRDELVDLMADAISAELDLSQPATGDHLDDLVRLGRQIRAMHRRHRWLLDAPQDRVVPGPNTINFLEYALSLVAGVDVPGRVKMEAIVMLSAVNAIFVRSEAAETGPMRGDAERQATRAGYLAAVLARGEHPHLAAALTDLAAGGAAAHDPAAVEDEMDRILRRVLAGLLGR